VRRPTAPVRLAVAIGAAAGLGLTGLVAAPASAAPLHVQALIDAAPAGGTVHLPAGTFAGGLTIAKSLTLVGAGASKTILKGGDSVITVPDPGGKRWSVTIADLTVTGGVAHGKDEQGVLALGGGVLVEGNADAVGSDVVLRRVVVSGNRAEALKTIPSGNATCPGGGSCPFAQSSGGGVASFGNLTLDHSVVKDNVATGAVSDAQGGGVWSSRGHLRILSSTITGNRAEPLKIGRFAEGGGVFTDERRTDGPLIPLTISGSRIDGNSSVLHATWPVFATADATDPIGMNANGGGLHVGAGYAATVDRTSIDGNHIVASDPVGEPVAFDSGVIQVDSGTFAMRHSSVDRNTARVVAATADYVLISGTAMELDGVATISDTTVNRNRADARGVAGSAWISNGLAVFSFDGSEGVTSLQRVVVSGNTATATTATADAHVLGVGVLNNSLLTVADSLITNNRGKAVSSDASAQGGGIWNGAFLSGPPVGLTVTRSAITGNTVTAKGGTAQGGGLYTGGGDGVTFSLRSTAVVGNAPDQVFDAATAPAARSFAKAASPRTHR
jgi:hypothetical protein